MEGKILTKVSIKDVDDVAEYVKSVVATTGNNPLASDAIASPIVIAIAVVHK